MEDRASSTAIVFLFALGGLQLGLAEEVLPTVQSGMRVAVLRVGAPDGTPSQIVFGTDKNQFSLGVNTGGDFLFSRNARPLLLIHPDDTLEVSAAEFAASYEQNYMLSRGQWNLSQPLRVCRSLELRGNIEVAGVKQFRIIAREDLSKEAKGWDNPGEHGNMVHVWTERHSQNMEQEAVNVCGGAVGEGKFASPIDVIIPHEEDSITVGFGSTVPCHINLFYTV